VQEGLLLAKEIGLFKSANIKTKPNLLIYFGQG
jgi:hypothetical protein